MLKILRPLSQEIFIRYTRQIKYRQFCIDVGKSAGISCEEVRIPVPWGHVAGKFWGDKNKSPVLALHGWQDNANSFDPLIPLLKLPSVLAIDLPGHGFSSHLPEGKNYDFEEFIILITRILQHYNLKKIGLLTHSLGGAIGYTYAAIFPDQIKWLINFECARSLLTIHRYNTPQTYSDAINMSIIIENKKKNRKIPAYKLSRMVLMSIKGSLGSIYSPAAAMTLLQRGIKEVSNSLIEKVDETVAGDSDLKTLVDNEMRMVKALLLEDQDRLNEIMLHLKKSINEAQENVKNYFANKNDDKYYMFLRDPLIKIQGYQSFNSDLIIEASKNIICPFLSLRAKNGFLHGGGKKLYEKSLEIIKNTSRCMEHHEVDGKKWGSANKRPLICLHGWLDNANSFVNLIPHLPPEFCYLAIDFPGHGLSSHFPQGIQYKSTDFVATVKRVQNYFNWSKLSLMGHSFGAQCSFLFSSMFSKDVDFFIALDAIKPLSFDPFKYFKTQSQSIQKFLKYESFPIEKTPLYTKADLIERWIKGTDNSLTEKSCEILMERGAEKNFDGLFRLSRDVRLKVETQIFFTREENFKFAKSIICDVLYIKAKDYHYFEAKENVFEFIDILKQSARSLECYELPGTHHFHLNNPEDIVPAINAFIKRIM